MNVYIIFDMDGWEIHAIDRCFGSYEKAEAYLEEYRDAFLKTQSPITFDDWKKKTIHTQSVL